jgi:hypothetical protein
VRDSGEIMARIVARSGFVVMQKPPANGFSAALDAAT